MLKKIRKRSPRRKLTGCVTSIATLMVLLPLTRVGAEDWPQFRGPNGTGVSVSTGLPEEFGPNKNVIWKTALPPGHSSPVLTKNRIFVTAYEKQSAVGSRQAASSKVQELNRTRKPRKKRITSYW